MKISKITMLLFVLILTVNGFAATKYWLGTDPNYEGDFQDVNNWIPAGIPTTGDVLIFDGRTTQAVTDGIAQNETGGIVYSLVHVRESFTGDIGDANERFHCAATKIIWEGDGTGYIEASEDDDTNDITISTIILNNKDAHLYLTSQIDDVDYCNDFDTVLAIRGNLDIGGNNKDTAVKYLYVASGSSKTDVAVVIHEDCERYKVTAYKMSIYMQNGTCISDSAATLIEQYGGVFTYGSDLGTSPETGMDITALWLFLGTFNWHPDDSGDDAYIGKLYLYGGTLNASATINKDRAKVLGNGIGNDVYIFEKGVLNIKNGMGNITIAPDSCFWNFGGTVYFDSGTQLGITY